MGIQCVCLNLDFVPLMNTCYLIFPNNGKIMSILRLKLDLGQGKNQTYSGSFNFPGATSFGQQQMERQYIAKFYVENPALPLSSCPGQLFLISNFNVSYC